MEQKTADKEGFPGEARPYVVYGVDLVLRERFGRRTYVTIDEAREAARSMAMGWCAAEQGDRLVTDGPLFMVQDFKGDIQDFAALYTLDTPESRHCPPPFSVVGETEDTIR